MLYTPEELFYCASLAVYVAVSLVIAVVRWGHKCEPFHRHQEYYYPAWKVVVWCFMSALLLVPCVFLPKDPDALVQVRIMLILSSPFYCAVIMFTYFGKVLQLSWWRKPLFVLAFLFGYIMLTAFSHTLVLGHQMDGFVHWLVFGITGVLSVVYLACFIISFVMVLRVILHISRENYSNPEDFPLSYASKVVFIAFFHIGISWAGVLVGTKVAISIAMLAQSVINVIFLVGALSPHRAHDVKKYDAVDTSAGVQAPFQNKEQEADSSLPPERREEILSTLRRVMETDQAFLDNHLTLNALSRSCGVNRTYLSRVMNESQGGFFNYVNRCRLNYADQLKAQHPEMSVDELAVASGFGSRQSYYNIRRSLNG